MAMTTGYIVHGGREYRLIDRVVQFDPTTAREQLDGLGSGIYDSDEFPHDDIYTLDALLVDPFLRAALELYELLGPERSKALSDLTDELDAVQSVAQGISKWAGEPVEVQLRLI